MTKPPKRPRDLNQWAKRMVDIATQERESLKPNIPNDEHITTRRQGKGAKPNNAKTKHPA
jgi:hypothetical protein